ncbi:bromo-adjacent homology (BAH) domain-containing protein [Zea mays]|uniref:Bromo-adjacent homology (BAH) domain-containing protein n=1 Tax=Zea mays TaxID=4577 RepID=A0A1D6QGL0_MAIZE|nr:bromo-adjacent homology (BAH) domain-containing protein [Zea mays]
MDRSKWFNIEWNDRLKMADDKGTLVYIQNLDIRFGPADIEELVRKALQLNCTAKPINHPTYDDPNNGAAGTRPLYCSKGLLEVPKPSANLVGHLSSYVKIGQKQRDEQKKAVATSHCSQPNTIEYDLALDWMLLREKQDQSFRVLHKKHREARKGFASLVGKGSKAE